MTREEAIKQIESLFEHCEAMMTSDEPVWIQDCESLKVSLTALRPVSRERMRGEWIAVGAITCKCSRCQHSELSTRANEYLFCPRCGAPMTDEAVEMVMERLEALKDES